MPILLTLVQGPDWKQIDISKEMEATEIAHLISPPPPLRIYLAINPVKVLACFAAMRVHHFMWHGHHVALGGPRGINIFPPGKWASASALSGALYPAYWNLVHTFSNNPVDIAIQFLPSPSSLHRHLQTTEWFMGLSGTACLCDGSGHREYLTHQPTKVNPRQLHQVVPDSETELAINLLIMHSPVRFPHKTDHFYEEGTKLFLHTA